MASIVIVGQSVQKAAPAAPENLAIVDRGQNHRTWQGTVRVKNPETGATEVKASRYVELGDGLNYWDDASKQWLESQDLIEQFPTGAVARRGPHKVIFSRNANTEGAIDMVTAGGKRFRSHVLGLYYFDAASGKSALIAQVRDSIGVVFPPNQIVYRDAFEGGGVKGDLNYIYTKGGFEQNVVLLQNPAPPEKYGLDPNTARIEVWTEYLDFPAHQGRIIVLKAEKDPVRRKLMAEPDLIDELLDFGEGIFPVGKAFEFGRERGLPAGQPVRIDVADPSDPNSLAVGKTWHVIDGRTILIEAVDYGAAKAKLSALPQAALPLDAATMKTQVAQSRTLLPKSFGQREEQPMQVAQNGYAPKAWVIDYVILPSTASSYTFTNGTTYVLSTNNFSVSNTATFQTNSVIKYATNMYLLVSGGVSFPSSGINPVMTSKDDNLIGDVISGSTGSPNYAAAQALWVYYPGTSQTVQNLVVRYAQRGVQFSENEADTDEYVSNVAFRDCSTGIYADKCTVNISSSTKCDVTTEKTAVNNGSFSGSLSDDCPDMTFNANIMTDTNEAPEVVWRNFVNTSTNHVCLVEEEGSVGDYGCRKLLWFGVALTNIGNGHFYGERDQYRIMKSDWKVWDDCHDHCHLTNWMKFELIDPNTGQSASGVAGAGKLGWHMYDAVNFQNSGNCLTSEMGIGSHQHDEYTRGTKGQWLDVTGVSVEGVSYYILRITINTTNSSGNRRYEGKTSFSNNVREVQIQASAFDVSEPENCENYPD